MNIRLLAFLSDIENALLADDPAPGDGGTWENSRVVNYGLGLAQLSLTVRAAEGGFEPRGTVSLQMYALADGTTCLKATLNWRGHEASRIISIYSKPGVDWRREARKVAAEWMGGPPPEAEVRPYPVAEERLEAAAIAG